MYPYPMLIFLAGLADQGPRSDTKVVLWTLCTWDFWKKKGTYKVYYIAHLSHTCMYLAAHGALAYYYVLGSDKGYYVD